SSEIDETNIDITILAVEPECAVDLSVVERSTVLESSVVPALNVYRSVIRRPPIDQARWRSYTCWFALSESAGVVDGLNLTGGKRAVENFDFINDPVKEITDAAAARPDRERVGTVGGRNTTRASSTIQIVIEIDTQVRTVE